MTRTRSQLRQGEAGSVVVVLLIAAALGSLVVSGLTTTMIETQLADRSYRSTQAFYQAEAGYHHAMTAIAQSAADLSGHLSGFDQKPGTADDGYVLGLTAIPLGEGNYSVRVVDNDDGDNDFSSDSDGVAYLWVRGRAGDAEHVLRITLDTNGSGSLPPGVYANGGIMLLEDTSIQGAGTRIHANGDLGMEHRAGLSGAPSATGTANAAVGTTFNSELIDTDVEQKDFIDLHSGADAVSIPDIDPSAMADRADYHLTASGTVIDKNGATVADLSGVRPPADSDAAALAPYTPTATSWNNWEYSNGSWMMVNPANTPIPATLFIDGDIVISSNASARVQDIELSLIATGTMSIETTGTIRAHDPDFLLVTGGGMKMAGMTGGTQFFGSIYSREMFYMGGLGALEGNVMAQNASNRAGDMVTLFGSASVKPVGGTSGGGGGPVVAAGWYEDNTGSTAKVFQ